MIDVNVYFDRSDFYCLHFTNNYLKIIDKKLRIHKSANLSQKPNYNARSSSIKLVRSHNIIEDQATMYPMKVLKQSNLCSWARFSRECSLFKSAGHASEDKSFPLMTVYFALNGIFWFGRCKKFTLFILPCSRGCYIIMAQSF